MRERMRRRRRRAGCSGKDTDRTTGEVKRERNRKAGPSIA